ncbi:MAG: hypothetical protein JWN44_3037 [Myxococcales bacterium]|nr:hypothetical protein [Myxococcales bacterium]
MSERTTTRGACLCGAVTLELTTDAGTVMVHCHCAMCRKTAGGSFATWIDVPAADARINGELRAFRSSPDVARSFCAGCGTAVSWQRDGEPIITIHAGLVDGDPGCRPRAHIWTEHKAPWVTITDGLPAYPRSRF